MFCKATRPHTLEPPQGGATTTTAAGSFTAEMEYAAALEEKSNTQAERIIEIVASVDGQIVLTKTTDCAASTV